jgi:hypothetical protein
MFERLIGVFAARAGGKGKMARSKQFAPRKKRVKRSLPHDMNENIAIEQDTSSFEGEHIYQSSVVCC